MINGNTCRAARGLLNWSTPRLAREAAVSVQTVLDLERDRDVSVADKARLETAFANGGVVLLVESGSGVGVRMAPNGAVDRQQAHNANGAISNMSPQSSVAPEPSKSSSGSQL